MAQKNGFLDNSLPNYAYICMCLRIKTYPIDILSCVLFYNADRLHRCVVLLHSKKKIALRLWHENRLMIAQKIKEVHGMLTNWYESMLASHGC